MLVVVIGQIIIDLSGAKINIAYLHSYLAELSSRQVPDSPQFNDRSRGSQGIT